jgi:hypothetical protein
MYFLVSLKRRYKTKIIFRVIMIKALLIFKIRDKIIKKEREMRLVEARKRKKNKRLNSSLERNHKKEK